MKMIKCLYHRLWYQLMTPACLQPALRSHVKASQKTRVEWFWRPAATAVKHQTVKLHAKLQTGLSQSSAILLSLVFFFHQQPVHWVRSSSEASILCLPSVHTHSLGQRTFLIMLRCLSGAVSLAKLCHKHTHMF